MISDQMLSAAAAEVSDAVAASVSPCVHVFSPQFEKKMAKLQRKANRSVRLWAPQLTAAIWRIRLYIQNHLSAAFRKVKQIYKASTDLHNPTVRKRLIATVISVLCVLLTATTAWSYVELTTSEIDWSMQGYLITADGEILETTELSITGSIRKYPHKPDELSLEILYDPNFYYVDESMYTYQSMSDEMEYMPYYFFCQIYTNKRNESGVVIYALDDEKGFFIAHFMDQPGQFLVAATSDVEPQEILAHFQEYVNYMLKRYRLQQTQGAHYPRAPIYNYKLEFNTL